MKSYIDKHKIKVSIFVKLNDAAKSVTPEGWFSL